MDTSLRGCLECVGPVSKPATAWGRLLLLLTTNGKEAVARGDQAGRLHMWDGDTTAAMYG